MPKRYDKILARLQKRPLSQSELSALLIEEAGLFGDVQSALEAFKNSGIPLEFACDRVYFRPNLTPISQETFCVVDIETNGHDPLLHTPIEIGALKFCGGAIVETFESFIFCEEVSEMITGITGITADMLVNAPKLPEVLGRFKSFLKDSIFVAHNVGFDYNFLSYALDSCGFGYLYNPKICTIKFAQRVLESPRYSLGFLNTFLEINSQNLHRAMQDSRVALEVFKICLQRMPENLSTSKDLLEFIQNPQQKEQNARIHKTHK